MLYALFLACTRIDIERTRDYNNKQQLMGSTSIPKALATDRPLKLLEIVILKQSAMKAWQ